MDKQQKEQLKMLKAARKASREEEIRLHGKPINYGHVKQSKKVYNRKSNKADANEGLPYFFVLLRSLNYNNVSGSKQFFSISKKYLYVPTLSSAQAS